MMMRVCLSCLLLIAALPAAELRQEVQQRREVAALLQGSYVFVGGGSGVVVSADGLILTNDHVAGSRDKWRIRFADGRSFMADRIATDPIGDICLLKIREGAPFVHVQLGTAQDIQSGKPVLAIGNPFSLGDVDNTPTVTAGALGTGRIVRGNYSDCVQLDAPVNPGNSGGPLLDYQGRLLGINGQIRTRTGMRINSGIGLAIACTQLRAFLPVLQSAKTAYVHHTAIPAGLLLEQREDGVHVMEWNTKIAAEAERFKAGDKLLRVANRAVTSLPTAKGLFASLPWTGPSTTIDVLIEREGQSQTVTVTCDRTRIGKASTGIRFIKRHRLNADGEREEYMAVGSVADDSPAAKAGVEAGWRLVEAQGQTILRRLDLLKVLAKLDIGDQFALRFVDDAGKEQHKVLELLPNR